MSPQIICEKRREPSDELKSVAPPPRLSSLSPCGLTHPRLGQSGSRVQESRGSGGWGAERRKKREGEGGEGGAGPAASGAGGPSLLSQLGGEDGRGGGRRRQERGGGEGGGNPMRHREERQCEGNASQHRESLSISISLSFPPSSVSEA